MAKRSARRSAADDATRSCPCGTGEAYRECCGRLHRGETTAASAEQLMRSRFSAYAVGDTGYLLRSWHSSTRPRHLTLDPQQRWTRLDILDADRGGLFDTTGTVEFRAHYRETGRSGTLHERSRFVREEGRWVYLDAAPGAG
ncbi:YchJ family protein [Micromonospora pattaloongensis]|uniref:YchJ family protein n=1 Tax=Micromonospora pattaloongensis TaxID=405436 RepID=UPI000B86FC4A|nr:YchJ family metal-binding protein [Micromonospora pattaloongensis]